MCFALALVVPLDDCSWPAGPFAVGIVPTPPFDVDVTNILDISLLSLSRAAFLLFARSWAGAGLCLSHGVCTAHVPAAHKVVPFALGLPPGILFEPLSSCICCCLFWCWCLAFFLAVCSVACMAGPCSYHYSGRLVFGPPRWFPAFYWFLPRFPSGSLPVSQTYLWPPLCGAQWLADGVFGGCAARSGSPLGALLLVRFTSAGNLVSSAPALPGSYYAIQSGPGNGGMGFGRGGVERHGEVLRDNIRGISKPVIIPRICSAYFWSPLHGDLGCVEGVP